MATIPGILPTVEPQGAGQPGFSAPTIAPVQNFAGQQMEQVGEGLLRLGAVGQQLSIRIQNDLDDARSKEIDTQFASVISDSLFNPETGYVNRVGKDAVDARKAVQERIAKARQDLEGSLENDVQKYIFKQYADRRMLAATQDIDQHAVRQLRQYNINESENRRDNLMQDAVTHADRFLDPADQNQFMFFKKAMIAEVKNLASLNGVPENSEQYKALERTATTRLHTMAISNFIANEKPALAQSYLKTYSGEIDKAQLDNITRAVTQAKTTADVKDESLRLSLTMKGTLAEQTAALNRMFTDGKITADVRDATLQRVEHAEQVRRSQRAEYERGLIGQAQQWLINNPMRPWTDMPTSLQAGLRNSGQLDNMLSFARNGRYVTQPAAYQEVMGLPNEKLARMSESEFVAKYRGRLDDQDLNTGLAKLRASKGTAEPKHLELISNADRVERAAVSLKILPAAGKPSGTQAENFDKFRMDVMNRVRAFETTVLQGKRAANGEELQKILDTVALDRATVPRAILSDVTKPISQMTTEEMAKAYMTVDGRRVRLSDISTEQRRLLQDALLKAGKPATEENIIRYWLKSQRRGATGAY
jgi:hypothetical protein